MEYTQFLKLMPRRHELQQLDADQSFALFRLLMLSSFADDEVTANERLALARIANKLPIFGHSDQGSIFAEQKGFDILANLNDRYRNDFEELVMEIARELGPPEVRLAALQLMARFVQTDGFVDDEFDFCLTIGSAMDLDDDSVQQAVEAAWAITRDEA